MLAKHGFLRLEQKQMAILLGRHQIFLDLEGVENGEKLMELNSNANLHAYFHSLARELDIMEPKTPEGIYKSHLEQSSRLSQYIIFSLGSCFVIKIVLFRAVRWFIGSG